MKSLSEETLVRKARNAYNTYKSCAELQRLLLVKAVFSFILTVLWYVIWISSAIRYFSTPTATFNPKNVIMYLTCIAIITIPFPLFKIHKHLYFKPLAGKIVKAYSTSTRLDHINTQDRLHIVIKPIGKQKNKKISVTKLPGLREYYREGNAVILLKGMKYPLCISESLSKDSLFCPSCGRFNPRHYTRCFECSSLMWNKDI